LLDKCHGYGIKVILADRKIIWRYLTSHGEAAYRAHLADALALFGGHPALYGFYIGDEPDAPDAEDAFAALRIHNEAAPHLSGFLNLLPWFDWIGERMGSPALAPYLDRVVIEGKAKILGYDCYAQMWTGENEEQGLHDYFHNLNEYYKAVLRHGVPFVNTVLSIGHYDYRYPTKDDMQWQLSTSAAHGAAGAMWFHLHQWSILENYANAPINPLGERTQEFAWLSEVNRTFHNYVGDTLAGLTIDECYHVGRAYGGVPLFKPFGNVLEVKSNKGVPAIISRFHDADGGVYYIVCNNSPYKSNYISLTFDDGVNISRCGWGNVFAPVVTASDPVGEKERKPGQSCGIWLSPGQLALLREERI